MDVSTRDERRQATRHTAPRARACAVACALACTWVGTGVVACGTSRDESPPGRTPGEEPAPGSEAPRGPGDAGRRQGTFGTALQRTWAPLPSDWTLLASGEGYEAAVRTRSDERVFLARVDLTARALALRQVARGPLVKTSRLTRDCLVGINGGYFGVGQSYSLIAFDGRVREAGITLLRQGGRERRPVRAAFGFSPGYASLGWVLPRAGALEKFSQPLDPDVASHPSGAPWTPTWALGGGPMILMDAKVRVTDALEVFDHPSSGIQSDARQPRTALGLDARGTTAYLMVSDGRQAAARGHTLPALASLFAALGADRALNLDGGASAAFVVGGQVRNVPSKDGVEREVYSALCLK